MDDPSEIRIKEPLLRGIPLAFFKETVIMVTKWSKVE